MLERFAELVTKRRTIVITAIALITLFFAYHMKNLKYENRMTHWFPQSDPVLKLLRETGDKFGTNELVMVAARPKSGGIFSPDFLQKLQSLTKELQEADHIFMVTSLTNMTQITRREWGLEVKDFLDDIPEEKGKLEELKSYALSQENYTDNVLSSDGEWTAMAVYIKPKGDTIAIFRDLIKPKVERYLADAAEILYSGIPSDSFYANEFTSANITRLVPAVVVLILAVLYFSFKSFRGVLYPTLVVGISSVWVFGLRGLLHWPMSLISPALPVFLVALGSAYGIHVVNKISFETRNEENKALKVRSAVSGIVIPVILTGVTTACGFASFATVKFTIVRDLGFFTAIGICFAVIISLTLIPSGYGLSSKKKKSFPPNQPALKFLPTLSLNVRK
ncbi:MAG: MMPL family transporter, partial [Candidatus Aminicenantes bacterium]